MQMRMQLQATRAVMATYAQMREERDDVGRPAHIGTWRGEDGDWLRSASAEGQRVGAWLRRGAPERR